VLLNRWKSPQSCLNYKATGRSNNTDYAREPYSPQAVTRVTQSAALATIQPQQ